MNEIDHQFWAKRILSQLVGRIRNFHGGEKFITYGTLANEIGYPEPHRGNLFAKNIGISLGTMGNMFRDMEIDGVPVPMIQALAVNQAQKLPSDGLKEFYDIYPKLSPGKKRDYVQLEYKKIFEFGTRWEKVLSSLGIEFTKPASLEVEKPEHRHKIYNPYGSEGSPEHIALRDFVAITPSFIDLDVNLEGITEYPLKSGDKIDVVFESENRIIAVEVKSIKSGIDDIERGLYQCVKYEAVLKAESQVKYDGKKIQCMLVLQGDLPRKLSRVRNILEITVKENVIPSRNKKETF